MYELKIHTTLYFHLRHKVIQVILKSFYFIFTYSNCDNTFIEIINK